MKVMMNQVKALVTVMEQTINKNSEIGFYYSSCNDFARKYQAFVEESLKYINFSAIYDSYNLSSLKNVFDMTYIEQKILFESVLVSSKTLLATLEGYFDFIEDEIDNLENFISNRLTDWIYDIILHTLYILSQLYKINIKRHIFCKNVL